MLKMRSTLSFSTGEKLTTNRPNFARKNAKQFRNIRWVFLRVQYMKRVKKRHAEYVMHIFGGIDRSNEFWRNDFETIPVRIRSLRHNYRESPRDARLLGVINEWKRKRKKERRVNQRLLHLEDTARSIDRSPRDVRASSRSLNVTLPAPCVKFNDTLGATYWKNRGEKRAWLLMHAIYQNPANRDVIRKALSI